MHISKSISLSIIIRQLIFLFLSLSCLELTAQTIRVGASRQIKTIKSAIFKADAGDSIIIDYGIYKENNIKIDKSISIIGIQNPIVDGEEKGFVFDVANIDSFRIKGLIINNAGKSFTKDYSSLHLYKVENFIIEDNVFNNPYFAMHIEKSNNGLIKNNVINGNAIEEITSGNGIHLWHTANVNVIGNEVYKMRDGIYFEFVKHSSVINNISKFNLRYGLHFMFSNNDEYEDNLFENNGAGVAVMFSKYISMKRNTFKFNWGTASYGLLLKEIYDADIFENIFNENTIAINAEGINRINFKNNTLISNGWAIRFLGACYENNLTNNNFLNNAFDISYSGRINGNIFDKNYWSDYTGYDLNKDGLGDIPYRPVKLFSYIVNRTPETIVLLRSLFVDLINFSEKVSPIFTPDNLKDFNPLMKPVND